MALNLGELFLQIGVDLGDLDAKFTAAEKKVSGAATALQEDMNKLTKATGDVLQPLETVPAALDKTAQSSDKAGTSVKQTGDELAKTGDSGAKAAVDIKETGKELDKAATSADKAAKEVAKTGDELDKTATSGGKAAGAVGQAEKSLNVLGETTKAALKPLATVSPEFNRVSASSDKAGEAVKKTGGHMHGAHQQAEGLVGALSDMQNQMSLLMGGMALSGALTVPFVAMAKAAAKTSIEFESAFAGVRKTVDATEDEFKTLENRFRSMSQDMPVTAEEFSRIGELAGQLGVRGVKNLEKFSDVVAKMGVSTNLSTEEAATSLARFANIMQMPIDNADKLGSTIVHLGNNLATTEAEITEFALRIAGAGRQVGLSESQVLGFGAALSSVGINAEAGGTAISRVFAKLANAVASGGDELKAFATVAGVSASQFATAFQQDAAGATVAFVTGLKRMQDEGTNLFGVMEQLELDDIRVRDALLRTAGAGDVLAKSLGLATQAWESNTALNKEASRRFATTESSIKMLQNTWAEFTREIGDAFGPAIRAVIGYAKAFVQVLQDLPMPVKQVIMVLGGVLAAVGPLMIALAGLGAVITGVKAALTTLGLVSKAVFPMWGAITLAVSVLTLGIAAYVTAQKKAQEEELKRSESLAGLSDRYNTLQKAIDSATASDVERKTAAEEQKKVIQEIGDLFPAMVTLWDEHGKAVAIDTKNLDANTAAAERNLKTGKERDLEKLNKDLEALQRQRDAIKKQLAMADQPMSNAQKGLFMAGTGGLSFGSQGNFFTKTASDLQTELANVNRQLDNTAALIEKTKAMLAGPAPKYPVILQPWEQIIPAAQQSVETVEQMAKRQKAAFAVVEATLKRVEAEWSTFTAVIGEATKGAGYEAEQQKYLSARLTAQQDVVRTLTGQYQESKQRTGEFSETTLELSGALDAARLSVAETEAQLREISGPIADAKKNLNAASEAVKGMKTWLETLSDRVSKAKADLDKTNTSIKELEEGIKEARSGITEALGAMRDRIKDVSDEMDDLKDSTKTAQENITSAFGIMAQEVDEVEDKISGLRTKMKDLANVKLVGETAFEDELASLMQREALVKLALNRLKQSGADSKDSRVADLEKQLEQIGLLKEEVTLKREVNLQPLKDQLKRMVDDSKELTFEEAKRGIEDYQRQITDLNTEQQRMTGRIKELQVSVGSLVPSVAKTQSTFDEAANSIDGFKKTIEGNNTKLAELQAKHDGLQSQYDDTIKKLGDLVPKIGNAAMSFDEAKTKIDGYSKTILENEDSLKPLRTKAIEQAGLVQFGNDMLNKFNGELQTLVTKENEAADALQLLRDAAGAAAAGLVTLGSVKPVAPATATPVTPAPSLVIPPTPSASTMAPADKIRAVDQARQAAQAGDIANAVELLLQAVPAMTRQQAIENLLPLTPAAATGGGGGGGRILRLAEGGVTNGPAFAQIGEAGREAITPLTWLADQMQAFARTIMDTMGAQTLAPLARLDNAFSGFNARVGQAVAGTFGGYDAAMAGTGAGSQPVVNVFIGERQLEDIHVEMHTIAVRRGRI